MSPTVAYGETNFVDAELQREALDGTATVDVRPIRTEAGAAAAATEAAVLVVDVHTPVTADALAGAEDLRLIARAGNGVDNVDVEAATERGVTVTNVPDYCTAEVATHAFGLFLSARRRIPAYDREVRAGEWDWETERPIRRVHGSTLGLVSFGAIARKVAEYAEGFGLDIAVFDPYVDESVTEEYDVRLVDFETLLSESDALSVHAPLTDETRGMIGRAQLQALPDHAVVVNVGRGGTVDEAALAEALCNDEIAAAGLDVLDEEPPGETPLRDRDDVVLTPHAGWYSRDARRELNETIARQVRQALADEPVDHAIDPRAEWV